jgi:hypothetical protein
MNYQAKIDIKKINKAFVMPIVGKSATIECVCIPTSEFYKGKNGELYCSMEIVEKKQVGQYGDTHFVKQQLEKESYKALSEDQKKSIPILGSFQPSKFGNIETVVAEEVKTQTTPITSTVDDQVPF